MKEYEQQCLQQAHTHPIMYLAQILPQLAQYAPEIGAHDVQSQGHRQGRYICNEASCQKCIWYQCTRILTLGTSLARYRLAKPVPDSLQCRAPVHR